MWGLPRKQPHDRFTGVNVKAGSEVVTCHSLAVEIALHSDSRGNYRQQDVCRGQNQLDRVFYTLYRFVPCIALFAVSQKIIIKKLSAQFYAHTSTNNRRSFFTRFASHSMDQTDNEDDHDNEIVYTETKDKVEMTAKECSDTAMCIVILGQSRVMSCVSRI